VEFERRVGAATKKILLFRRTFASPWLRVSLSFLFRKPAIGIEEFDADALFAIGRIRPDAIDFSLDGSTVRRCEANLVPVLHCRVRQECSPASTDLNGDRIRVKRLSGWGASLQYNGKVNGYARAARALRRLFGLAFQFFIHQARLALSILACPKRGKLMIAI
jgi:hypothetical protein